MQMLEPRGSVTCASCGMSRPIFQKSIANGNVVFSVCVWHAKSRTTVFKGGVPKLEKDYGPAAWKARHADRRCCRDCVLKLRGYWSCADCLERKPYAEFTAWKENRDYRQNGTQLCNTCISLALACQIARRAKLTVDTAAATGSAPTPSSHIGGSPQREPTKNCRTNQSCVADGYRQR